MDAVVIVGSQAILVHWPDDPPFVLIQSTEIDAYPLDPKAWQDANPGLAASEEINALFGFLSRFDETHGFYIDGVDAATAKLPADWRSRQVTRMVSDGDLTYRAIAPGIHDLAISKLLRFDDKDQTFVQELYAQGRLDRATLIHTLEAVEDAPERKALARSFIAELQ